MDKVKKLKMISANCRGLADRNKRREVLNLYRKKSYSVICLQDIHLAKDDTDKMRNEWGLQSLFAPFKSNARGVAILFNKDIDLTIHRSINDENGNFIITDITVEDKRLTLAIVYGPNSDDPNFYLKLFEHINSFENESVIIVGDWNLVLDPPS